MTRAGLRGLLLTAVGCAALTTACDPEDACDPGYYADHGFCYPDDAGIMLFPDPDDEDSGVDAGFGQNPNATFGTPCTAHSECGGDAPVCGGPQLPMCTAINCLSTGTDICPAPWVCIDITKYDQAPGITHVCFDL